MKVTGVLSLLVAIAGAIAAVTFATAPAGEPKAAATAMAKAADLEPALLGRSIAFPLPESFRNGLRDTFDERRGTKRHEALDVMAPRGTPVTAMDDGRVMKLFTSVPGGLTLYQSDPSQRYVYYYAHLDSYAPGLREGAEVKRGELIGYVGSTGNASADAPHLHFTILRMGPEKQWWKGEPVNPYPYLAGR